MEKEKIYATQSRELKHGLPIIPTWISRPEEHVLLAFNNIQKKYPGIIRYCCRKQMNSHWVAIVEDDLVILEH